MTNKSIRNDTRFGTIILDRNISEKTNENLEENDYLSDEKENDGGLEIFEDLEELELQDDFELLERYDEEESLMDDDSADL